MLEDPRETPKAFASRWNGVVRLEPEAIVTSRACRSRANNTRRLAPDSFGRLPPCELRPSSEIRAKDAEGLPGTRQSSFLLTAAHAQATRRSIPNKNQAHGTSRQRGEVPTVNLRIDLLQRGGVLSAGGKVFFELLILYDVILSRDISGELCDLLAIQILYGFLDLGHAHQNSWASITISARVSSKSALATRSETPTT